MKRVISNRFVVGVLSVVLSGGTVQSVFASDLRSSIPSATQAANQENAVDAPQYNPPRENRYLIPSVSLIAGGGFLMLFGVLLPTGGCKETLTTFSCSVGPNKALLTLGGAMAGGGALLFLQGERDSRRPHIVAGAGRLGVMQRVAW
jgi:hypothetical protein